MGIFRRIRQAAEIALEIDPPSQNIPPVEPGENAWTEVQLAALPPGHGRAIVQATDGATVGEGGPGSYGGSESVEWILRLRLPGGEYGPRERRTSFVPRTFAATVARGDEVPVSLKDDGSLHKIDVNALKAEGLPRPLEKPDRVAALREAGSALAGALRRGGGDEPTAAVASMEPVDGVTYEAWVEGEAAKTRRLPAPRVSAAAEAEWTARVAADQALRKRYASDLTAAIKRQAGVG
jgi:hypothetical protein